MSLSAGTKLGPYLILGNIGAGGMGEVYKANDTRLDRVVAIKVSKTEFSECFEREAKAIAALNHPNICTLYDVGPNYLVMGYIEGTPLKGPLPQWSQDGRELFFFSGQKMMVVDVHLNGVSFSASAPKELFSAQVPAGYSNDSHRWQLARTVKDF